MRARMQVEMTSTAAPHRMRKASRLGSAVAGWLTAMSGAPLPSSSQKTSVRVVSGRRHAGSTPRRPSHSRLLLAICGPRESLQKKDFLFAEVDSEDLC